MLKNYLKIAFRNLVRHRGYSTINIAGLAIGMACSIFILLWVRDELSYDRFHADAGRIYRITAEASGFKAAVNPYAMPPGLMAEIPSIQSFTRISHQSTELFQSGDKKFWERNIFYADSNFLQFFSFPLLKGDPRTALARPESIVLSEDLAKKYFGNTDVLGKTLRMNNQDEHVITGVSKNVPRNSHLQFDMLMPLSYQAKNWGDIRENRWDNYNFYSYLKLAPSFQPTKESVLRFDRQMDKIYHQHEADFKVNFFLQPLTRIHLHSNYQVELPGMGNIQYVNILFVVALFILVVAAINFMNLATARSARRAKEVGLRKVVGAERYQLIGQFLGESVLIALISFLLAIGIVWLLMPAFNAISGKSLGLNLLDPGLLLLLLGVALGTGLLAGLYPALFLSGFQPVKVLKGKLKSVGGNLAFRNVLVVTQFVVSIVLLVGTAVVYRQLKFIQERSLGFDKENLIYTSMSGDLWNKWENYRSTLRANSYTSEVTFINDIPTNLISGTGNVQWDGKDPNLQVIFPTLDVDDKFFSVFHMELLNGRAFSEDFKGDTANYVVNEKAAKAMGMTTANAVGKSFTLWRQKGIIIGVVKDFNFKPIQNPIEPLILRLNRYGGYAVVRARPGMTQATIAAMQQITQTLNPSYPFTYNFLDQDLANLYQSEQRLGKLFNVFAALAIFISCLGLYGLSAFIAEQRTREIGVRKVLGASVFSIVRLLSSSFTRLILVAVLIAVPLSWYATKSWLNGFAYRIEVSWIIFVVASLAALLIAWVTVSYESLKAATTNPAASLKAE